MRIAFVTPEYVSEKNFYGGLSNYIHRTCKGLSALGHKPIVFVVSDTNKIITHNNITVHRINCFQHIINICNRILCKGKDNSPIRWIWQSYLLNRRIKQIHSTHPFDIIQYTTYTATALFRVKKIPSVMRISSYQPLIHKEYGFISPTTLQKSLERLEKISFKKCDSIYGPSKKISSIIARITGKDIPVIASPYNCPDTIITDDSIYRKYLQNKKYFLFFGTIGILKGVSLIASCIHSFLQKYANTYFVFVGKDIGYKRGITMMKYIRDKSDKYNDRIIHIEPLQHSYLVPIIRHAHAVVLPSNIDNFPNACLESMALSKIVIGTHDTSFDEIITDGINGFLCKKNDSVSLLNCLSKTADLSKQQRNQLEQSAYNRIIEFDYSVTLQKLITYFDSVINTFKHP